MTKQERYDRTYLSMATEWSKLSHCSRKQVGALIVKNGMIISDGYNGTPTQDKVLYFIFFIFPPIKRSKYHKR